jgi:hypothetical protein
MLVSLSCLAIKVHATVAAAIVQQIAKPSEQIQQSTAEFAFHGQSPCFGRSEQQHYIQLMTNSHDSHARAGHIPARCNSQLQIHQQVF